MRRPPVCPIRRQVENYPNMYSTALFTNSEQFPKFINQSRTGKIPGKQRMLLFRFCQQKQAILLRSCEILDRISFTAHALTKALSASENSDQTAPRFTGWLQVKIAHNFGHSQVFCLFLLTNCNLSPAPEIASGCGAAHVK